MAQDWTGIYVGGSVARRTVDANWKTTCLQEGAPLLSCPDGNYSDRFVNHNPVELSDKDTEFGVYAGAQFQFSSFVVGVEGDWGRAHNQMRQGGIPGAEEPGAIGEFGPDEVTVSAEWDASIRGRLGFLITPTTMFYGTAGISWLKIEASAFCGTEFPDGWCVIDNVGFRDRVSEVLQGYTVGGGMESMLTENIIFRAEYRHSEYDALRHIFFDGRTDNSDAVKARVTTETDTFSLGLAYKF